MGVFRCLTVSSSHGQVLILPWSLLDISFGFRWVLGLPGGSDSKVSACNAGDLGSIPGSGRCPGEGNGNPLQ